MLRRLGPIFCVELEVVSYRSGDVEFLLLENKVWFDFFECKFRSRNSCSHQISNLNNPMHLGDSPAVNFISQYFS